VTTDADIYEEVVRLTKQGVPSALAILVNKTGSAPQRTGAKMVVRSDGSILGTIGGGQLEARVIELGLQAMASRAPKTVSVELTEEQGYGCGGKVTVYVEPMLPAPRLFVFGAGHVGRALCFAAKFSGFHVTIIDDRPEFANPERLPDADDILVSDFEEVFSNDPLDGDAYVVIATRGHEHDFQVLKKVLKTKAGYVGLVGSRKKKEALTKTLEEDGFTEKDIKRVLIPVGLSIGSVTPEEIAISIIAQVIQHRRRHGSGNISSSACSRTVPEDGHT
jgi:xanthine dehydrogenase accessory factor